MGVSRVELLRMRVPHAPSLKFGKPWVRTPRATSGTKQCPGDSSKNLCCNGKCVDKDYGGDGDDDCGDRSDENGDWAKCHDSGMSNLFMFGLFQHALRTRPPAALRCLFLRSQPPESSTVLRVHGVRVPGCNRQQLGVVRRVVKHRVRQLWIELVPERVRMCIRPLRQNVFLCRAARLSPSLSPSPRNKAHTRTHHLLCTC